jgi:hypothetical protein
MRIVAATTEMLLDRIQCMRDSIVEIENETDSLDADLDNCCGDPPPPDPPCIEFYPVNISSNYQASTKQSIICNSTAGGFTVTLPIAPAINDYIDIYDAQGTFQTNNVILARNGEKINGLTEDLTLDINVSHLRMLFNGGAQGWVSYNM